MTIDVYRAVGLENALLRAYSEPSPWAGISLIEFPVILLVGLGVNAFLQNRWTQIAVGLFGGLMLLVMAYELVRTDPGTVERPDDENGRGFLASRTPLVSGIVTTSANPYFFLWWATVGAALIMAALRYGIMVLLVFAVVHWSIDLVWLSFVSYTVNRTKEMWSERTFKGIFWSCGILLAVFAVWFIWTAVMLLW